MQTIAPAPAIADGGMCYLIVPLKVPLNSCAFMHPCIACIIVV